MQTLDERFIRTYQVKGSVTRDGSGDKTMGVKLGLN
jgi:hypothetical protein